MSSFYSEKTNTKFVTKTSTQYDEITNSEYTTTEIYKKVYSQEQFYKVFLSDFLYALDMVSNSRQLDVLIYILKNIQGESNLFAGTMHSIADEIKISSRTVFEAIKKLISNGFMKKVQTGLYLINPKFIVKGNDGKKRKLVIKYEQID